MTMPNERTRAVIWAIDFLRRLGSSHVENSVKKIPSSVRKEARDIMRHFPYPHDLKYPDQFDERIIDDYYRKLDEEYEVLLNTAKKADI